ncbi:hypothetical protein [Kineosporia babensis]|uniref:DUF397 domain-containing protein n=1 Tax=Kineosporia babensis TaxID=499548 RepID=A0A9X1SYG8_9ACTN|nr:hypothetical protein [Kineosporia babensis]MCD5317217.1 hypothetical protein [Kineosporia babensis]
MLRADGQWQEAAGASGYGRVRVRRDSRGVGVEIAHPLSPQVLPFDFTRARWVEFLDAVKAGEFDLDDV